MWRRSVTGLLALLSVATTDSAQGQIEQDTAFQQNIQEAIEEGRSDIAHLDSVIAEKKASLDSLRRFYGMPSDFRQGIRDDVHIIIDEDELPAKAFPDTAGMKTLGKLVTETAQLQQAAQADDASTDSLEAYIRSTELKHHFAEYQRANSNAGVTNYLYQLLQGEVQRITAGRPGSVFERLQEKNAFRRADSSLTVPGMFVETVKSRLDPALQTILEEPDSIPDIDILTSRTMEKEFGRGVMGVQSYSSNQIYIKSGTLLQQLATLSHETGHLAPVAERHDKRQLEKNRNTREEKQEDLELRREFLTEAEAARDSLGYVPPKLKIAYRERFPERLDTGELWLPEQDGPDEITVLEETAAYLMSMAVGATLEEEEGGYTPLAIHATHQLGSQGSLEHRLGYRYARHLVRRNDGDVAEALEYMWESELDRMEEGLETFLSNEERAGAFRGHERILHSVTYVSERAEAQGETFQPDQTSVMNLLHKYRMRQLGNR